VADTVDFQAGNLQTPVEER